jgi:hypothetical protein
MSLSAICGRGATDQRYGEWETTYARRDTGEYYRHGCKLAPVNQRDPAANRSIRIRGETVLKIQDPAASRRERLRTAAAFEVGRRTGLFVVPKILSYDDSRGEIVFERLNLTGLREALSRRADGPDLVSRAARALAAIHQRMKAPPGALVTSPGEWGMSSGQRPVPLHGDFGMRNLFCISATDDLAIIDWANADWMGFEADLGPAEVDVAVFLMSLFHQRLFGPWPIPRRREVARQFLSIYSSVSAHPLNVGTVGAIVAASTPSFHQQTRQYKGRFRALAYRHNLVDLYFFLRRLSGQGFTHDSERFTG